MLEFLREEHRAIERLLIILQAATSEGNRLRHPELLVRAIELLQGYAVEYHQSLEEKELFPRLEKEGIPKYGGPLEVLLAEHRLTQDYVEDIQDSLKRWQAGDEKALQDLEETIQAYSMLLRAHIGKEDMVILPMAQHVLEGEKGKELVEQFKMAHCLPSSAPNWDEFEKIVAKLEEELGIPQDDVDEQRHETSAEKMADAFIRRKF